jgi:3-phenylpropionate/trans-cinnamate dioxygenase ferredoxin reductase subunit
MHKTHRVIVDDEQFSARRGELLLDAALMSGVHIPHDCRSGHCGTCRVRVVEGVLFGSDLREAKACQCRVIGDVVVAIEDVPEITTVAGRVTAMRSVAPDVVELCLSLRSPLEYLPGQYVQVQFRGFPSRCYSPTVALDRSNDKRSLHLHVRRVPGGRVSAALGADIAVGHRVKLKGPYGSAYLRPGMSNPLVLVCGGTGFAPIWSIADAAIRENPRRDITAVVGARTIESLYMIPALWRLAAFPNVSVHPVTDVRAASAVVRTGSPVEHLPRLYADDIVYAAGPPPLVAAVADRANAVGATWYADAFVPSHERQDGLLSRAVHWVIGRASLSSPTTMASQVRR